MAKLQEKYSSLFFSGHVVDVLNAHKYNIKNDLRNLHSQSLYYDSIFLITRKKNINQNAKKNMDKKFKKHITKVATPSQLLATKQKHEHRNFNTKY